MLYGFWLYGLDDRIYGTIVLRNVFSPTHLAGKQRQEQAKRIIYKLFHSIADFVRQRYATLTKYASFCEVLMFFRNIIYLFENVYYTFIIYIATFAPSKTNKYPKKLWKIELF